MLRLAAVLVAIAGPAAAQSARCLPRETLVTTLGEKYSEHLAGGGLQSAQQLIEVWASDAGSFTIFVTRPDGFACIMATGQAWQTAIPKHQPPGEPG